MLSWIYTVGCHNEVRIFEYISASSREDLLANRRGYLVHSYWHSVAASRSRSLDEGTNMIAEVTMLSSKLSPQVSDAW